MIPIILLFFIIDSCHGEADFNSRARNFSIELIHFVNSDHIVIAPFTVWSLMAVAALGTSGDSSEEISMTLILPKNNTVFLNNYSNLRSSIIDLKSNGVNVKTGDFIFINNDFGILPNFRETLVTYFGTTIKVLNFEDPNPVRIANTYIDIKYPDITGVFHQNDFKNATMIMSSVIHFNGKWKSEFNVSNTKQMVYVMNNNSFRVNMMHQKLKLPYSNMDFLNANVAELEFGDDGKFSLLLILPYQDKNIKELYHKFDRVTFKDIFDKLQSDVNEYGLREVDFSLPRFRIKSSIILNRPLNHMGIHDIFEPESDNFRGISTEKLYISSIEHKAVIFCTESGVIAKASIPGYFDNNHPTPEIEAEQPFIFFIVEKSTQTILFGGFYSKSSYF